MEREREKERDIFFYLSAMKIKPSAGYILFLNKKKFRKRKLYLD